MLLVVSGNLLLCVFLFRNVDFEVSLTDNDRPRWFEGVESSDDLFALDTLFMGDMF